MAYGYILSTEFKVFLDLFIDIYFAFIMHFRETDSFFFRVETKLFKKNTL